MSELAIGIVLLSTFLHAGWNVLAKSASSSSPTVFLHACIVLAVPGVLVVAITEAAGTPLLGQVWAPLLGAGLCQGIYFVGLSYGYHRGDLGVVYPITRGLPVLFIGATDSLMQRTPSTLGWVGLAIVAAGCTVVSRPLPHSASPPSHDNGLMSYRRWLQIARWAQPQVLWAMVAALGTVGYTVFDKHAAEVMADTGGGLFHALRYGLAELVLSTVVLVAMLTATGEMRRTHAPAASREQRWRPRSWSRSVVIGLLIFGAYGLVLWSYQLAARASYIFALRQCSIILAVVFGAFVLREPAPGRRIIAALIITVGVIFVTLAS